MAMKTMNLAKLPFWIILVIHIFHFGVGETFKWIKSGCSNYTFHAKSPPLTWEQSRQLCKKTGLGDLVSIEREEEWTFLKDTILNLTMAYEYFIGLRKDDQSGQWRWLSNNSTSQTGFPWALREPNGDGNCATIYKNYQRNYGKYSDLSCTTQPRPGYICEFPVDRCKQEDNCQGVCMLDNLPKTTATSPVGTASTISSATSHGAERCSCYSFVNERLVSWPLAMASCKLIDKDLVVIETEREWKFITTQIRKIGKYNEWHIGLYKSLITGNWTWINGLALTMDKWQENTPNDNDSYALIAKEWPSGLNGSFRSITGDTSRGWICEKVTDNCQGVCLHHNLGQTTPTSPKTISSPKHDPTNDPEGGKQADDKDKSALVVIILGSIVAVLSAALLILGVCFLSWRKRERKDVRNANDARDQLDNQDGSSLRPENVARELGFSEEAEPCDMRRENQRRETDQSSRQECGYAMLTPCTVMVSGDRSYASLEKSNQGDCINDSSVAASPLLPHDDEHHACDQLPTYVNIRSANYANIELDG